MSGANIDNVPHQQRYFSQALKLAERTIQFADTLTVLTEGYLRAGRVSHAEGSLVHATTYYSAALEGQPKHILGAIGLSQMQMQNGLSFDFRGGHRLR